MSRGPGQIERAIRALFDASPDLAFVTDELAEHCYPGIPIERKHQVAVLRAAHHVADPDPNWDSIRTDDNGAVFLNRDSIESYGMGKLIAHSYYHTKNSAMGKGHASVVARGCYPFGLAARSREAARPLW